jgi:hypothetical protein
MGHRWSSWRNGTAMPDGTTRSQTVATRPRGPLTGTPPAGTGTPHNATPGLTRGTAVRQPPDPCLLASDNAHVTTGRRLP